MEKMRRIALTLFWIGLLGCPVTHLRAQSLYGPGGLFLHPTANVPAQGQLTLGALILQQRIPPTPGLHTNPTWGSVSLDYGLTPDVEIGVTGMGITDFKPSYGGFLKYRFQRESGNMPALAVGFTYSDYGGTNSRAAFVAARKQLSANEEHPIVGHVGLQYIDSLAGFAYEQVLPHVGVEYGLAPRWTLIAEARPRGRGDFKTSTALSVAYRYSEGGQLVLSWLNTGQSTQSRFGFGVGYLIGGRR
jgi:hypothetical protein